jgi:hypothetical protein
VRIFHPRRRGQDEGGALIAEIACQFEILQNDRRLRHGSRCHAPSGAKQNDWDSQSIFEVHNFLLFLFS